MQSSNAITSHPPEVTIRPEPGVARGRWEAPPWVFFALLAAAVLGAVVYAAAELRRRRLPR